MNLVHPVTGQNVKGGRNWSCIGKGEYIRGLQDENDVERRTDGRTDDGTRARAKECKEKLDPTETRPKVTGLKGGDQGVEFCCDARLWETTPQDVSLSFHPWSNTGPGSAAARAARAVPLPK